MMRLLVVVAAVVCSVPAAVIGSEPCEVGGDPETCMTDDASLLSIKRGAQAHQQGSGRLATAAVIGSDPEMSITDDSSLLSIKRFSAHGHQQEHGRPAKCNEILFEALCYRTCTDMGEMEPRSSAMDCGGRYNLKFAQSCSEDGSIYEGSGQVPGTGGRPFGGCAGDASSILPKSAKEAPNICMKKRRPPRKAKELAWKCSGTKDTPVVQTNGTKLTCQCPLGYDTPRKFFRRGEPAVSVLTTSTKQPCDTACTGAEGWLVSDGLTYCCPRNQKPKVEKEHSLAGHYKVTCSCKR